MGFIASLSRTKACGLQGEGMQVMTIPWEAQDDSKRNGGHGVLREGSEQEEGQEGKQTGGDPRNKANPMEIFSKRQ